MKISEYIKENYLVLDGATGTMLQKAGVLGIPELVNVENPKLLLDIQKKFVAAGADLVLTCTFGANRKKIVNVKYSLEEIIKAACKNARMAVAKYVALDIGPIGEMLEPNGTLTFNEAYDIFAEIINIGKSLVDVIYIETMTDLLEIKAALIAA